MYSGPSALSASSALYDSLHEARYEATPLKNIQFSIGLRQVNSVYRNSVFVENEVFFSNTPDNLIAKGSVSLLTFKSF